MSTELLAMGPDRPGGRGGRSAAAARDVFRAPVSDAHAAVSLLTTFALVGMWAVHVVQHAPSAVAPAAPVPELTVAASRGETAVWDGTVEFDETGVLAGVVSVAGGPVIPVLGVQPHELRDTFGAPRDDGDRRHAGIDIGAPRGTPVAAALDGWIVSMSSGGIGGLGVHVLDRTGTWLLYYSHLEGYREDIYPGLAVRRGELLGYVGATGNANGWPHLHFEAARVRSLEDFAAQQVNPYEFLLGR